MSERILITVPSELVEQIDAVVSESDFKRSDVLITGARLFLDEYNRKKRDQALSVELLEFLSRHSEQISKTELVELLDIVKQLMNESEKK